MHICPDEIAAAAAVLHTAHTVPCLLMNARLRIAAVGQFLRSSACRLTGNHQTVRYTEPGRIALRCVNCGHVSPGWDVAKRSHA